MDVKLRLRASKLIPSETKCSLELSDMPIEFGKDFPQQKRESAKEY